MACLPHLLREFGIQDLCRICEQQTSCGMNNTFVVSEIKELAGPGNKEGQGYLSKTKMEAFILNGILSVYK